MLHRKGWSLAKTSLCAPFSIAPLQWVVSRRQLHECEARARAAGTSRLNEFQTCPATRFICGRPDSHEQWYSRSIHITILPPFESGSGSTSCTLLNSWSSSSSYLQWWRQTKLAIKQRTSEPDRCSWLSGLPRTNRVAGERRTKGSLPVTSLFFARWC